MTDEQQVVPARVAVGIGLSGESGYVLEKVVALAGDPSLVAAVHVIAPKHQLYNLGSKSPQIYDLVSANVSARLERLCRRFGVANYHVRTGHSPTVIAEFAAEAGASIIAIGTHGRQGHRRFLGQTSNDILHRPSVDVLAVQTPDELPPVAAAYRRILVAIDPSLDVDRVLKRAQALRGHFDARLDIATVIRPASYLVGGIDLENAPEAKKLEAVALERLEGVRDDVLSTYDDISSGFVRRGDPAVEIQRVTDEIGADLVVLGIGSAHGETWLGSSPTLLHDIRQDLYCVSVP